VGLGLEGEIDRLINYIADKYSGLMVILNEAVKCISPLVLDVCKLLTYRLNCDRVLEMMYAMWVRYGAKNYRVTSLMPLVEVWYDRCKIGIIEPGMDIALLVKQEFEMGETFTLIVRRHGWAEVEISSFVDGFEGRCVYGYVPLPCMLMLLYKYTKLGRNDRFVSMLKSFGLYDLVKTLSNIEFKVEYPISEAARSIFGDIVDKELGTSVMIRVLEKIVDKLNGLLRSKEVDERYELYAVRFWPGGKQFEVRTFGYPSLFRNKLGSIKPIELLNLVDESIFALAYHAAVLTNMYKYLSGEV